MSDPLFVAGSYTAASITQDDQECINYYCEVDPMKNPGTKQMGVSGERGVIALYPTPGTISLAQLLAAEVRGIYTVTGGNIMIAVSGNYVYSVNSSFVAIQIGTLLGSSGQVSMIDNGVSVYLVDGQNRYAYGLTTGIFSVLADGAFNGADRCGTVDTFIFYNNPQTSQWGCTNALSSVSSGLNLASMIGSPNNIVSIFNTNREVFLLGEKYSEPWINVGNFPFPFSVIPGTSMQHGCAAKHSVARFGESFAFLAQDDRGKAIVVMMKGYQPERISNFALENSMTQYSKISDAIAFSYQQAGHEFYVIIFPTADITWVYDLASGYWHKWLSMDANGVFHRHRSNCCAVFQGKIVVGDYQNGMLYQVSQSVATDNGAAIKSLRRARHMTDDLKRVFHRSLQLQFQPGIGLAGNPIPTGANYVSLPGISGSYASTPSAAVNQITGDIDIQAFISPVSWTPASPGMIVSKSDVSGNQRAYRFFLSVLGQLVASTSPTGVAFTADATSIVVPPSTGLWVRWTRQMDNGAAGHTDTFYTSTNASNVAPSWIQLGTPIVTAGTTSIFASSADLEVGTNNSGTGNAFQGNIYSAAVYNGINGTLAASMVANDSAISASSWISVQSGETWTIHGTAAVAGNYVGATQGSDPQAMLRWSDDGGFTWSNEHWASLGKQGAYRNRAVWRQLGESRDRVYEVSVTDPVYRTLVSAELMAETGAH